MLNAREMIESHMENGILDMKSGRKCVDDFNDLLIDNFYDGYDILDLSENRLSFIDELISTMCRQFSLNECEELAVVAVGGYGRRQLHPYTDIDILILLPEIRDSSIDERVASLIALLWDCRLDVGSAVRTVQQCVDEGLNDLTVATNLLEKRLVWGSEKSFQKLCEAVSAKDFWPIEKFYLAKLEEQKERHGRYLGTMHLLEPDLKNMPGGLRDIQTIMWIAGKLTGATSLSDLVNLGFLTEGEFSDLAWAENYLWRVRAALQISIMKNENRLTLDRQTKVAEILGFIGEGNRPVENMMTCFYQAARVISEINEMILAIFREAIFGNAAAEDTRVLNSKFMLRGTLIDTVDPDAFDKDPASIMEMFEFIASYAGNSAGKQITGLHHLCVRKLRKTRRAARSYLEKIPACRRSLLGLFSNPDCMDLACSIMHRHSIMSMYTRDWEHIAGQMQFDMFHTYTVDEHCYRAMKFINDTAKSTDHAMSKTLFRNIFRSLAKPQLLYIATMLHDIGKGLGGNHALRGAEIAEKFCKRHDMSNADVSLVTWLVGHHLDFSITAQRRDISDPAVIQNFAEIVMDETRLDYLYCLTVADICATNDNNWNSWKDGLFRQLYYSTQLSLRQGLEKPIDWSAQIRDNREDAISGLSLIGISREDACRLWSAFPEDYFLKNSSDQIFWHTRNMLTYDKSSDAPLVLFGQTNNHSGTEIFVYCKERDGLFAGIVSMLATKKISVISASIMASSDGYILDTFIVTDSLGKPIDPADTPKIKKFITMSVMDSSSVKIKAPSFLPAKKYRNFSVPVRVHFLDIPGSEEQGNSHVEISALDRPGLLALIAEAFGELGIGIRDARIATSGEKADDGFTLTKGGKPLSVSDKGALREAIKKKLEIPEAE